MEKPFSVDFLSGVCCQTINIKTEPDHYILHYSTVFCISCNTLPFLLCIIIWAHGVMLLILAYTFAVRWIAKAKPLVDNMLSVCPCYSSLNCINVVTHIRETVCLPVTCFFANVSLCCNIAQLSWLKGCMSTSLLLVSWKFMLHWNL